MPNDCINIDVANNFAAKDTNRIVGQIAKTLARKSPFINVLDGGTLPNVSETVRSVVQEMSYPNSVSNIASPTFTDDISMCGIGATPDDVGSTEYSFKLETLRGRGPRVCVKTARTAFKNAYLQAQISLEKTILQIINADIRFQLQKMCGIKYVVKAAETFGNCVRGDMQALNTTYGATTNLPTGDLNFRTLYRIGSFLREEMLAEPFSTAEGEFFRVIASADAIEKLRNDADVKEDLNYLSAGSFKLGEESIKGYQFQGYRGFAFGIDQQPLRFNTIDANGYPVFINPITKVSATNGFATRRNSAWVSAAYEVALLIGGDSFKRLIPESYTGEGTFKWAPQLFSGELEWTYFRDNDCNMYGDFGQHIYQIQRAYQPVRPQNVAAIAYKRCGENLGVTTCTI
jgi:hypothetical protein